MRRSTSTVKPTTVGGKKLQKAYLKSKMSVREFAEDMQMKHQQIYQYFSGQRTPGLRTAYVFKSRYGIKFEDWLVSA